MFHSYTNNLENANDFFVRHGFALIPLRTGSKAALETGWPDNASADPAQWESWRSAGYNLGIHAGTSTLIIVDLDTTKEGGRDGAWRRYSEWCEAHGLPVFAPHCSTARQGMHVYFKIPAGVDIATLKGSDLAEGINVLCGRRYAVAPGSVVDFGGYSLFPDAPPPHVAPVALIEHCRRAPEAATTSKPGQFDPKQVAALVEWLADKGAFEEYADWVSIGMALAGEYGADGLDIWRLAHDDTVSDDIEAQKWRSFATDTKPGAVTLATWFKRARQIGWAGTVQASTESMFAGVASMVDSPSIAPSPVQLPPCPIPLPSTASLMPRGGTLMGPRGEILPIDADDSLALDFTDQHVGELRHCEEWGRWLRWDGIRWKQDRTAGAYNLVRQHLRRMGSGMHLQDARKILSAKTVAAVERMAKTDPRIATVADAWDADPWLLNTPGGVVDLRTCVIRESRPSDHMTKITAVAPGGDCPTWKAFLHKSLAGDVDLIAFVQRMLGYSLTGDTREQALFFLYGQGGNGKGVLLNTVASILADYAKTAPMATFTDSANASDRHPTDLAGLRGARFVMASETERGRKWAEAKIKSLTGGDPIAARFMGRDFFEYVPQFKLVIAGNHKPRLGTVDEAIRRRMNMVPFTVQIPEHERDKALPEKLKAEWGGILQWMVEGCLAWQRDGLRPPAAVRSATEEYLNSQDALATWLDERCEQAPDAWAGRTGLFTSWSTWAIGAREPIGNASEFYQALTNKGFPEHKRDGTRGFRGIRLQQFTMVPPPIPERQNRDQGR